MLLAFRFITGFVGSPVLATGGATIADMYLPQKQVYGIAVWGISAVCGPALGPLVGGFAAERKGWTWTIWELLWLSGTYMSDVHISACISTDGSIQGPASYSSFSVFQKPQPPTSCTVAQAATVASRTTQNLKPQRRSKPRA